MCIDNVVVDAPLQCAIAVLPFNLDVSIFTSIHDVLRVHSNSLMCAVLMFVCMLSIYVSICLSICLSTWLPICLSVFVFICLSVYRCTYVSTYLFVCLSVCLSIGLSVCHISCSYTITLQARLVLSVGKVLWPWRRAAGTGQNKACRSAQICYTITYCTVLYCSIMSMSWSFYVYSMQITAPFSCHI